MMIDFEKLKRVHLIGIGGIHVSAVAKLLLARGTEVSGSDLTRSEITDELERLEVKVNIGRINVKQDTRYKIQDTNKIPNSKFQIARSDNKLPVTSYQLLVTSDKIDLVIYSDAVPENDTERMAAKKLGIPQMSSYDFVGELSKDYYTIAISGTNGKSTTTAMLGLILEAAGLDPTVIVGTKVREWNGNLRIGKSKYLVTEADEYKAHMLNLSPQMIVLTNIEEDHLDFYRDLDDIVEYFKKYVQKLPNDGVLVYNMNDCYIAKLLHCFGGKKVGYDVENGLLKLSQMSSNISNNHDEVFDVKLQVPGEFNRYNAAGAASAAKQIGVSDEIIKKSLENFRGTWRRFEIVGECKGATVISDYAHHPTALAVTIKAVKEFYPGRRLIAVFQPHQHNRTRKLFDDFVRVLAECEADILIISEIYDVAGRTTGEDKAISSENLVLEIKKLSLRRGSALLTTGGSGHENKEIKGTDSKLIIPQISSNISNTNDSSILYAKDLEETRGMIVQYIKPKDIVLIMGAGDIDKVAREIIN